MPFALANCDWLSELKMGQKQPYPTSAQLDASVLQMHTAGISYAEAVQEFRKQFILTALRDLNWNETRAARALGMHRNTLARTLRELNLDVRALRKAERRPVRSADFRSQKILAL